ncbi:MAG: type III pantothenate kinase [Spirochaetales bacterium]|nr:MAG: type III pantothenate kinase [Spirochaetales bacterium]
MILGFDIGNSNTVLGIYAGSALAPGAVYRYRTQREASADETGALVRQFLLHHGGPGGEVEGVVFSSVVPELNRTYHEMSGRYFGREALEISCNSRLSIRIRYDDPSRLGVDRIVNAEAAYHEYARDCIIVDIGTATTFCVLHADGAYDGGIIGPGIGVTIDALSSKTSQLPRIPFEKPARLVAGNTEDALKSGFYYGWLSFVEGMIARINEEYGRRFLVILTGGYSGTMLGPALKGEVVIDSMLTMKGIRRIYELHTARV